MKDYIETRDINPGKNKLPQLQILRCVAAILVVFAHSIVRVEDTFQGSDMSIMARYYSFSMWCTLGVDLFFVLSGFIMFFVSQDAFGKEGAQKLFLVKRVIRVVPIYYILTTVGVILLSFFPALFTFRSELDIPWIIFSYLFIPFESSDGVPMPVLGLGWTLNCEMYFYAVFSALLVLRPKMAIITLTVFFSLSIALGLIFSPDNLFLKQASNWRLLEFLFGVWIAYIYLINGVRQYRKTGIMLGIIGMLLLPITIYYYPTNSFQKTLAWGVPSALIVYACLMYDLSPGRLLGIFVRLGDASYSIYLVQVFSLPAFAIIVKKLGLITVLDKNLIIFLLVILTALAGYIFYLLVELPLTRTLTRLRLSQVG